mmetsp:Transcript_27731/g.50673  ORF Transcript_27731/g.50673 Transcript_27731/m.50673 type:complete len:205 (-) Transcript_27731:60-674(-)
MDWTLLIAIGNCVWNWYFTHIYAALAQQAKDLDIFNSLYSEYSQPEFLDAIDIIEVSRGAYLPADHAYSYICEKVTKTARGKKLHRARRQILRWYHKVQIFYQQEHLQWESYGSVLPGLDSAAFFIELIEPLVKAERLRKGRPLIDVFDWYREMYRLQPSTLSLDEAQLVAAANCSHSPPQKRAQSRPGISKTPPHRSGSQEDL